MVITLRIKKYNVNINELSNYRPISQLPTLAKLFERLISKQLTNHLNNNNLLINFNKDTENLKKLKQLYSMLPISSFII